MKDTTKIKLFKLSEHINYLFCKYTRLYREWKRDRADLKRFRAWEKKSKVCWIYYGRKLS